jgi:predicted ATPase/class 3 adenylate cyclase
MPALPSGTVTFLFTDIEGSTARWEHERHAMADALVRHNRILREVIDANGGVFFKTVGDAVQAAFPTAADGCAAAVEAQRRLGTEAWATGSPVRVRMALHTGIGIPSDLGEVAVPPSPALQTLARIQEELPQAGDYLTPVLNRLARLLSTGHGGQILLTRATLELVRDCLPAGSRYRDLGVHRLRDLIEPEHVFQLEGAGLALEFPPLKTSQRHDVLPPQHTPFIGREREVTRVTATLEEHKSRLLTLTGPGGTGKTRLSIEVATQVRETYADGVVFVDLSKISDPAQVPATIARAFGLRDTGDGVTPFEQLQAFLGERTVLLVLDNFEHVTPAAETVKELLGSCPALTVLTTSRAPLGLYGERVLGVPPLTLPDPQLRQSVDELARNEAVRLFVERAQATKDGFALNDENAADIVQICHRLDGLPLAIEFAAARVKLLPPRALRARLERRLKLLTNDVADRPGRQQTLRAAIDWSHDLLSAEEQRLFRRLSVLVGGGGLDAAEALGSAGDEDDLDVLEVLSSLVDKSLLRQSEDPDGEPRYGMLETIREYGLERLEESGEAEAVRERHAAVFGGLARDGEAGFGGPDQARWLDRLEREHDNLRAALSWLRDRREGERYLGLALSLWRFWNVRGYLSEGRRWLSVAVEDELPVSATTRARALLAKGVLVRNQGDYVRAHKLAARALLLFEAAGDKRGIAGALNDLAAVAQERGDDDEAAELVERSLSLFREVGDRRGIASALTNRGLDAWERRDLATAKRCFDESLAEYRALGDERGQAVAFGNLGEVAHSRGEYEKAKTLYEQSLAIRRSLGDKRGVAMALCNLVTLLAECGDATPATVALGEESVALFEAIGDREGVACALCALGQAAHLQNDRDWALSCGLRALSLFEELEDPGGQAEVLAGIARVLVDANQDRQAAELTERNLSLACDLDDRGAIARALEVAGELAMRHDQPDQAASYLGAAHGVRATGEIPASPVERARATHTVATIRARLGESWFDDAWEKGHSSAVEATVRDAVALVAHIGRTRPAGVDAAPGACER